MRALVTGAAGFLGDHVRRTLEARGVEHLGLARSAGARSQAGRIEPLDLHDAGRLERCVREFRPTHVFHMAGTLRGGDAAAMFDANVVVTEELMSALRRLDTAPVVVLPGSAAVYGRPRALPIDEEHPVAPQDLYGVSKAAQELVVDQHHRAWGCPVRIMRIFNVVGPGQPDTLLASSVARQIVANESGAGHPIEVGNLDGRRDLVDVRDVARACVDAARLGGTRWVLNVCSGESVAMRECVERLVALARAPVEVIQRESRLRDHDVPDHRGDRRRIEEVLGWRPTTALGASLADLLQWWRGRMAPTPGAALSPASRPPS